MANSNTLLWKPIANLPWASRAKIKGFGEFEIKRTGKKAADGYSVFLNGKRLDDINYANPADARFAVDNYISNQSIREVSISAKKDNTNHFSANRAEIRFYALIQAFQAFGNQPMTVLDFAKAITENEMFTMEQALIKMQHRLRDNVGFVELADAINKHIDK